VSQLQADWHLSRIVQLFGAAGGAYFFNDLQYLAAGSTTPLLSPYRVRLRVDLGAQVLFF
jgi:hypothetical protein